MRFWQRWFSIPAVEEAPLADPPSDQAQLGAHAKRLLDDPVLKLAFDRLAEDVTRTWRNSEVAAVDVREAAYRMHWAIEGVKGKLRAMLSNLQVLEAEQRRREAEEERRRQRGA